MTEMDDEDFTFSSRHIEPLLQCSVCLDRFKTPKLLPCQHTYCQSPCLEQLVNPRTRMIKCPECRADHLVPRGGTASYPNNITIMGFMDLPRLSISAGDSSAPIRRDEYGSSQPVKISEKEGLYKKPGPSQPDICSSSRGGFLYSDEPDLPVVVAPPPRTTCSSCFRNSRLSECGHCQQQICEMCCRQHMEQVKVEIERMLYRIKRGLPKISHAIDDIGVKGSHAQQKCESIKQEINDLFQRLLRDFQTRQRILLEQVDTFLISELQNLRTQQENLEVELASMASFCDSSETAISHDSTINNSDIMQLREQCQENCDTMQGFDGSQLRQRANLRHIEIKAENQQLTDAINTFGEIEVLSRPRAEPRSYQGILASRLVDISRPEGSRYQSYTSSRPSSRNMDTDYVSRPSSRNMDTDYASRPSSRNMDTDYTSRPSSRNMDTDYALSIIGSHNPQTSPASERRRTTDISSYRSRNPVRDPLPLTQESDNYEDASNFSSRPPASTRTPRRRPRREHHSDTRIPAMMGGAGGEDLFSRYRRQSLGGLSPPRETEDFEDDDQQSDLTRNRTFVRDPPTSSRPSNRLEVPIDNSSSTSPEDESPRTSYQRPSRAAASNNQSQSSNQTRNSNQNRSPRTGRSPNRVEPRNRYNQKGRAIIRFGTRGNGTHEFTWPRGVAVSPLDDTIFVADSSNHRVQVFDNTGQYIRTFGSYGNDEGEFDCLAGITVNNLGQVIIADRYNHRIQIFDHTYRFLTAFGEEGSQPGQLCYPWGITCDNMGFIYVCDKENSRVQVFQSNGAFVRSFGELGSDLGQLDNPQYIAVSPDNKIYVSDSSNHRIQVFSMYGDFLFTFGNSGTVNGEVKYPRGITIDAQGFVVVADSGNNRVQIFRPDGSYYSMFGSWGNENGQFKALEGLAILANGNVVVSDRENHRIQIF